MKHTAGILALILLFGSLIGCQSKTTEAPELLEPVGVKTDSAAAQYGDIYDISVFSGEIVPYMEELCFEVDGKLGEVPVSVGDTVKAGDLLVTLDSEALLEQIEELEADIAYAQKTDAAADRKAEIKIEIAKLELEGLEDNIHTDPKTIKAKELEIEQLEADREQARQLQELAYDQLITALAERKEDLACVEIRAPFDGTVVYVTQEKAGTGISCAVPVATVVSEQQLYIVSDYIPEYTLQGSDRIYAQILGEEYEITYVPMETEEYLEKMLSGAELESRFSVENTDGSLKSGLFAAVTVIDHYQEDVLVIPINSLYRDAKGHYVYRLIEEERIRQDITVGATTGIEAQVIEGLEEGDVIYVKE